MFSFAFSVVGCLDWCCVVLCCICVATLFYLSPFPRLSIRRSLHIYTTFSPRCHAWSSTALTTLSGPLARVGPNDLVTCDPDILRRVWAVRSPYRRGEFYDAMKFNPTRDNLLSLRSDTAHNVLRAKMAAGVCHVPCQSAKIHHHKKFVVKHHVGCSD